MEQTEQTFHCETYKLDMPVDRQRGFCAIQFRKGRCADCERGKEAAEEERQKAGISSQGLGQPGPWSQGTGPSSKKEVGMAEKKLCSCGCGKQAVKDGLATKCYRKKHGVAPYDSSSGKKSKAGRQGSRLHRESAEPG